MTLGPYFEACEHAFCIYLQLICRKCKIKIIQVDQHNHPAAFKIRVFWKKRAPYCMDSL